MAKNEAAVLKGLILPAAVFLLLSVAVCLNVAARDLGIWWGLPALGPPVAVAWAACFVFFLGLRLFLRDAKKAFALALFLFGSFFLYEQVLLSGARPLSGLLILAAFMTVGAALIAAFDRPRKIAVEVMSALLVIALTKGAGAFVVYVREFSGFRPLPPPPALFDAKDAKPQGALPDIYFIVLDAYGRDDVLKRLFGYDNAPFLSALEGQGFYVARDSAAAYPVTTHSVTSTLNLNYIQDDLRAPAPGYADIRPLLTAYHRPRFVEMLKGLGYEVRNLSMAWYLDTVPGARPGAGALVDIDDVKSSGFRLTPAVRVFQQTPLDQLLTLAFGADRGFLNMRADIRDAVRAGLRGLNAAALEKRARPVFVYAHFMMPHPPFVLRADGGIATHSPLSPVVYDDGLHSSFGHFYDLPWPDYYRRGYIEQVRYINGEIEAFVRAAVAREGPKVILVQSDHGTRAEHEAQCGEHDLAAAYASLNAVYFSDGDYGRLYPAISPLNTFRAIANKYFGLDLPMLPQKQFCMMPTQPYDLTEVTESAVSPAR